MLSDNLVLIEIEQSKVFNMAGHCCRCGIELNVWDAGGICTDCLERCSECGEILYYDEFDICDNCKEKEWT